MKTFKNKTIRVHDKTFCDCCGKQCTDDFYNENEYASIEATWGYNSGRDGEKFDIQICENCFGDMLSWMRNKRKEYLGPCIYPHKDDPLKG